MGNELETAQHWKMARGILCPAMSIAKGHRSKILQFHNVWLKACYRNYKIASRQNDDKTRSALAAEIQRLQALRMLQRLLLTLFAIAGCLQRSTATHLFVAAHSARPYAHSAKRKIQIRGAAP
jgi:hypothetical protein